MMNDIVEVNYKSKGRIQTLFIKIKAKFNFIAHEGRSKSKIRNVLSFCFSKQGLWFFKKIALSLFYSVTNIDFEKAVNNAKYGKWRKKDFSKPSPERTKPTSVNILLLLNLDSGTLLCLDQTILSIQTQATELTVLLASASTIPETIKTKFLTAEIDAVPCATPEALQTALHAASENYILIMNSGDLLSSGALAEFQEKINENDSPIVLYSDEDLVNENGEFSDPLFKPDWSPYNLYSRNYIGQSAVITKSFFLQHFKDTLTLYGALLALPEESKVVHLSSVLYSVRKSGLSNTLTTDRQNLNVLKAKLANAGLKAEVSPLEQNKHFFSTSIQPTSSPKVSIIIPTKDKTDLLKQCVDSILELSTYKNYEIIIIDNNSVEKEFFDFIEAYSKKRPGLFKCFRHEIPFNFADLINFGVSKSEGEYMVLLNNDTKLITPDWLEKMMGYAQLPFAGAIGIKLLYPDLSIQHAGVVIGIGGAASHVFLNEDRYSPIYHNYINVLNTYSAVTAACLMIKKDRYNLVNGFDPQFASDYNDIDFCLKLARKGLYNLYLPEVEMFHYESVSRGKSNQNSASYQRYLKETLTFKKKWRRYINNDPFYNKNLTRRKVNFNFEPPN